MKEKMIRFLHSINIVDTSIYDMDFVCISKSPYHITKPLYLYSVIKDTPFTYKLLCDFLDHLSYITSYDYEFNFTYKKKYDLTSIKSFIDDFIYNTLFDNLDYKLEVNRKVILTFNSKEDLDLFNSIKDDLDKYFRFVCLNKSIETTYKETLSDSEVIEKYNESVTKAEKEEVFDVKHEDLKQVETSNNIEPLNKLNQEIEDVFADASLASNEETKEDTPNKSLLDIENEKFKEVIKQTEQKIQKEEQEYKEAKQRKDYFNGLYRKSSNYKEILISQIDANSDAVTFTGKVFEREEKEAKGRTYLRFGVFQENGAIYCNYYPKDENEDLKAIADGINIRINGKVNAKFNPNDPNVIVHSYEILPNDPLRDDEEEEKRVELHLHTKFSEMDSIASMDSYCELASHMGMKAIAVTDHGVVQSFPEAQKAAKKYNIKMLYGSELYLVEDDLCAALNPCDKELKDATYVVVDCESTGLSIEFDRITEIGAFKVKGGMLIDRFDMLVNPGIPIPKIIQEKTNITEEMVKDCPKIDEVLPEFLKFVGDSILVTHNGEFDYSMINEAYKRIHGKDIILPVIDTLAISRYLYPDKRKHSLGALCSRLDVDYDKDSAHRADYDASVLASCWNILKGYLEDKKEHILHSDLLHLPYEKEALKSMHGYHTCVICKDRAALKNLYKIISASHCDYIGTDPLVPRSLLNQYRDSFFVGSACFNGEVFQNCVFRNSKKLAASISYYDYIELQPLENYMFLVNDGQIPDVETLKKYLVLIINEAKKQKKMICATGDCHYVNKEQKIYRDILINNQAVGGGLHPLFRRSGVPIPDQHFLSTREMLDAFSWYNNQEEVRKWVIDNTNYIADQCSEIIPIDDKLYTPEIDNCEQMLTDMCYEKAHREYGDKLPSLIEDRLKRELDGIISNGYSVTYYIAHELVRLTNEAGYIVGSRGSVGSSFAAYCAGITEVNPLPPHYRCPKCKHVEFHDMSDGCTSGYDLPLKRCPECGEVMIQDGQNIPFETFLGFKAEKVPDIDLNFPADFQSKAHLFTKKLLGENNVFRAGTISTAKLKTAIGYVREYFKNQGIDPNTVKRPLINALAFGCTSVKRTTGQHPGGIVVVPRRYEIYDFTPVQYPANDTTAEWKTTHFDFHAIHDTILKLDMLGHVDPQALKMMCDLEGVDIHSIPMNDKKVLSLFISNDALNMKHKYIKEDVGTTGIPEFGTNFVKQLIREAKPKTFRDLLIISGLSHGTNVWTNNAQDLIKSGVTDLNGVIGCRDDIMSFLISKGLDNSKAFTIMETVRKGKKLSDEQIHDMESHNVPNYYIESCKKIKYLFPKGHACAYIMMAIRVGYFKVYYPLAFYATFFTLRCDQYDISTMIKGIDAVHERIEELENRNASNDPLKKLSDKEVAILDTLTAVLEFYERGFKFETIDINKSEPSNFIIDRENNALIPPFKVLDGFGENGGEQIKAARASRAFDSISDFSKRGKVPEKVVNQLRELGAFKGYNETDELSLFDNFDLFG